MEGVVYEVPVPSKVPAEAASYQEMVPAEAVAPSVNVPVPQREAGVVEVMAGTALIVAVTEVLAEVHEPFEVST